jgi:hypothetical protein
VGARLSEGAFQWNGEVRGKVVAAAQVVETVDDLPTTAEQSGIGTLLIWEEPPQQAD